MDSETLKKRSDLLFQEQIRNYKAEGFSSDIFKELLKSFEINAKLQEENEKLKKGHSILYECIKRLSDEMFE